MDETVTATYRLTKAGIPLGIIINILYRVRNTWLVVPVKPKHNDLPCIGVRLHNEEFEEKQYKKDFGGGIGPRKYHRFVRYNNVVTNRDVEYALCEAFRVDHLTHSLCTLDTINGGDFKPVNPDKPFWDRERKPAKLCAYNEAYYIVHVAHWA